MINKSIIAAVVVVSVPFVLAQVLSIPTETLENEVDINAGAQGDPHMISGPQDDSHLRDGPQGDQKMVDEPRRDQQMMDGPQRGLLF